MNPTWNASLPGMIIWWQILAMNNILPWSCACLKTKSMCKSHRIRSRQNFVSNVEKLTFSMVQNKVFLARCLFFLFIVMWPSACNHHFDIFHFKILKHCYHVWNIAQLATNLYALGPPDTLPIHPRRELDLGQNCNWSVPVQIPFQLLFILHMLAWHTFIDIIHIDHIDPHHNISVDNDFGMPVKI